MKSKTKPGSKIPTTKTNTNKKKGDEFTREEKSFDTSLIKKNEFALILFGALFFTVIVFFLFFRSSSPEATPVQIPIAPTSYADLEKRINTLESTIRSTPATGSAGETSKSGVDETRQLAQRVARLEAAFSVKFDSLIDRLAGMEKTISQLKSELAAQRATPPKKTIAAKPTPTAKAAEPAKVKKAVKKSSLFHTVKKGETLYSISKKYNTTVAALRKLNNLTEASRIYPGNNILIR